MATYTSIADGNASVSNSTVWDTAGIPGSADDVVQKHNITWDQDFEVKNFTLGSTVTGKTLSIAATKTLTINTSFTCTSGGTYSDQTLHNTLQMLAGSKLIFKPGAAATVLWTLTSTTGKLTLDIQGTEAAPCEIKTDLSNGGNPTYMVVAAGFGGQFCVVRGTVADLIVTDLGDASHAGLIWRSFGSQSLAINGLFLIRTSAQFDESAQFGGFSGTFTATNIVSKNATAFDGSLHRLWFNHSNGTRTISNVYFENVADTTSLQSTTAITRLFYYTTSTSAGGITLPVGTDISVVLMGTANNPHTVVFPGSATTDGFIIEMPDGGIVNDQGENFGGTNATIKRAITVPVRTGSAAGTSIASFYNFLANAGPGLTLQNSVLRASSSIIGNIPVIYCGEGADSIADLLTELSGCVIWGSGIYLDDTSGTPAANAFPPANVHHNLTDSGLTTTAKGLGIGSDVNSAATFNANGVTVVPTFAGGSTASMATWGNFASWGATEGADGTEAGAAALLADDPSLLTSYFTYMFNCWRVTNPEAEGSGPAGSDMGVGYVAASTGRRGMNHRTLRPY